MEQAARANSIYTAIALHRQIARFGQANRDKQCQTTSAALLLFSYHMLLQQSLVENLDPDFLSQA